MNSSRYEQICIYKKNICTICHSKYCKGDIRIKNKGGVTTIKCNEYNVTRKDQLKMSVKSDKIQKNVALM